LVDDFAKDVGVKTVDNPSKVMKRIGAGKIAIPAVAGAYLANRLYQGKGDKDMKDKQAYISSQDLEKLAQENPELAEEISLELLNKIAAREFAGTENDVIRKIIDGSLQGGYMKTEPRPMQREASVIDKDVLEKIASKDMDLAEEISDMILKKEASNLPMKIVNETKGISEADKKKLAKIIAAAGGTAMAAGIGAKATKAVKNKKKKDDEEKAASVIDKDILEKIAKEDKELAEEISRMILEKSAKEKIEPKEIDKEPKKDNPGEKLVEKEQKKMKPEKAAEETDEKQEKKASELTQEDLKKIKEILSK
jgi:hypothetical protein